MLICHAENSSAWCHSIWNQIAWTYHVTKTYQVSCKVEISWYQQFQKMFSRPREAPGQQSEPRPPVGLQFIGGNRKLSHLTFRQTDSGNGRSTTFRCVPVFLMNVSIASHCQNRWTQSLHILKLPLMSRLPALGCDLNQAAQATKRSTKALRETHKTPSEIWINYEFIKIPTLPYCKL